MDNIEELLNRARKGDRQAVELLLESQRKPLEQFVELRLEPRLTSRVDALDIVQDTLMEANCRIEDYLMDLPMPFPEWLRSIAKDRINDSRRRHYADKRDINRETPIPPTKGADSQIEATYEAVARGSSPSSYVSRKELHEQLRKLMESLPEKDREILTLRFFDHRPIQEISGILGLTHDGARMRLFRAVERLKDRLNRGQGGSRF